MDIWLAPQGESTQIHPLSVHGMLWLQTHFEEKHWNALAESRVKLPTEDIEILSNDAKEAGLTLSYLSDVNTKSFQSQKNIL